MGKRWKCARCAADNDETAVSCASCGLIRGGVVVQPNTLAPRVATQAEAPVGPGDDDRMEATAVDADAVAAPSRPLWRRIPTGWAIVIAIVVVSSVAGLIFNATRSSTGEIDKAGDLAASELRVGDCFDLKDPAAEQVGDVTARPCTQEHEYELFAAAVMPAGDFPAQATLDSFANDTCTPAFESYIGKPYTESPLEIFVLQPTSDAWSGGDRSVQCAVYHPRVHRLTESLKGSNQ